MRLWSIDPKYLDTKGLTACWREALLARKVLQGKTKGYKNHPQLIRFKKTKDPLKTINVYLYLIYLEAKKRNYNFDQKKLKIISKKIKPIIKVTSGQIKYEFGHLQRKLKKRDRQRYKQNIRIKKVQINSLFKLVKGEIERWEKSL